jgi:chromosome partitioning protein
VDTKLRFFHLWPLGNLFANDNDRAMHSIEKQRAYAPQKARLKAKISVSLAAKLAFVEPRTWRQWEVDEDSGNARSPSPAALWSFITRSGITIPVLDPRKRKSPLGIAFTIASSKGGVGKTPITLNVAACLVEQGFQVAIVTDDLMYRLAVEDAETPKPNSLVSKIDFYDELDLIVFPREAKQRCKELRRRLATLPPHQEQLFQFTHEQELKYGLRADVARRAV